MQPVARGQALSLRRQLLVAGFGVLLPLLVVTMFGALLVRTNSADLQRTSGQVVRGAAITDLLTRLAESGRAATSLVVDQDRRLMIEYLKAAPSLDQAFTTLMEETPASGRAAVAEAQRAWRDLWLTMRHVEQLTRGPKLNLTQPVVVMLAQIGADAVVSSEHMDTAAQLNAVELLRLQQADARRQLLQELLLVLSAGIGIVVALLFARRLTRRLMSPLEGLIAASAEVGREEEPSAVPLSETPELRRVAVAFNQMAARVSRARAQLGESERWFRSVVQNASDLILVVDLTLSVRYLSPSARRSLGLTDQDAVGHPLASFLHPDEASAILDALTWAAANAAPHRPIDCRLRQANGSFLQVETLVSPLPAEEGVAGLVLTGRDVSERKVLEQRLRRLAFHDDLTGLPNRALLRERLTHQLARRRDEHGRGLAVLFVDLDDFKTVNDSLGHVAGDELLRAVAEQFRRNLRPADTAARIGGDEFVLLLEDLPDDDTAREAAGRLLEAVERPVMVAGHEVYPKASVGIAIAQPGTLDAEALLTQADLAMYRAKRGGEHGRIAEYHPAMAVRVRKRLTLTSELQRGVREDEFELHYQPIVDLASRRTVGAEALLRWRHPKRGLLLPAEFLAVAEETGLLDRLGRLVLENACRQASAWCGRPGWTAVHVNVTAAQLLSPGFLEHVEESLSAATLSPQHLALELTESALPADMDALIETLSAVRRLGVLVVIDDFGTGYSSLGYLRYIPVDILKLDKSFVDALGFDDRDMAITRAVIELAATLRLAVVAEGVERQTQADELTRLRCSYAQGFYFSKAIRPEHMPSPLVPLPG